MGAKWFYTPDGRTRLGPFSLAEMRELVRAGRLRPTHMVRREDSPRWAPASSFAELFSTPQPPPKTSTARTTDVTPAPRPGRSRRRPAEDDEPDDGGERQRSPARTKRNAGAARFVIAPLRVLAAPWRAAWQTGRLTWLRRRVARQRSERDRLLIAIGVELLATGVRVPGCEALTARFRGLTQAQELARRASQAGDKEKAQEAARLEGELRALYTEVGRRAMEAEVAFDGRAGYKARLRRGADALAATEERLAAATPKNDGPVSPRRRSVLMGCAAWGAVACALVFVGWRYGWPVVYRDYFAGARPRPLKELFVDLSPAVPVVEAVGAGTGSGFLIKHENRYLVVTNRHVVENARDGVVVHFLIGDGRGEESRITVAKEQTSVIAIHRSADLAVVDVTPAASLIDRLKIEPVRLAKRGHRPQVGEHVFTIGHPGGGPEGLLTRTLSDGIVSAVGHKIDESRFLQVTVPLNPGNSGGPLFDDRGHVVGVSTFVIRNSPSGNVTLEALNFALEGDFVHELVEESDKSLDAPAIQAVLKPPPIDTSQELAAVNARKLDRLSKAGFRPYGPAKTFRLPAGKQRAFLLQCKKGEEFALTAVSQGVKNLNMAVLSREGGVVASDVRAHPDPEVTFRVGADGTYALAVENPAPTEAVIIMTLLQK
jgi:S1-C subfamily serine protease